MKIRIDSAACTGHGRCYALAPAVFEPDDEGHSIALFDDVPDDLRDQALLAVGNCPEQAISIIDD
jgi:ferredoxin